MCIRDSYKDPVAVYHIRILFLECFHYVGDGVRWEQEDVYKRQIHIYMDKKEIRIKSDGGKGVLNIPTRKGMKAMTIEPGEEHK